MMVSARSHYIPTTVVEDLWGVVSNSLTTPSFFLSTLFSIVVVYTHVTDPTTGVIAYVLNRFSDHAFAVILVEEIERFLGLLCFVPVLFNSPRASMLAAWLLLPCLVFLIPPQNQLVYAATGLIVHVYLHVKLRASRVVCVGIAALFAGLIYAENRVSDRLQLVNRPNHMPAAVSTKGQPVYEFVREPARAPPSRTVVQPVYDAQEPAPEQ